MRELKHSISIELDGKKLSGYEQEEQSVTISNAFSDIERSFETHFNACFIDVDLKNLQVEWDAESLLLQLSWKSVVLKKQPFKNKGSFLEIMELPGGNWKRFDQVDVITLKRNKRKVILYSLFQRRKLVLNPMCIRISPNNSLFEKTPP